MATPNKKTVKLGARIITARAKKLRDKLIKITEQKIPDVILDFAKVIQVDSIGLSLVLATFNTQKNNGGNLSFVNVPDEIHHLFKIMQLDNDPLSISFSAGKTAGEV